MPIIIGALAGVVVLVLVVVFIVAMSGDGSNAATPDSNDRPNDNAVTDDGANTPNDPVNDAPEPDRVEPGEQWMKDLAAAYEHYDEAVTETTLEESRDALIEMHTEASEIVDRAYSLRVRRELINDAEDLLDDVEETLGVCLWDLLRPKISELMEAKKFEAAYEMMRAIEEGEPSPHVPEFVQRNRAEFPDFFEQFEPEFEEVQEAYEKYGNLSADSIGFAQRIQDESLVQKGEDAITADAEGNISIPDIQDFIRDVEEIWEDYPNADLDAAVFDAFREPYMEAIAYCVRIIGVWIERDNLERAEQDLAWFRGTKAHSFITTEQEQALADVEEAIENPPPPSDRFDPWREAIEELKASPDFDMAYALFMRLRVVEDIEELTDSELGVVRSLMGDVEEVIWDEIEAERKRTPSFENNPEYCAMLLEYVGTFDGRTGYGDHVEKAEEWLEDAERDTREECIAFATAVWGQRRASDAEERYANVSWGFLEATIAIQFVTDYIVEDLETRQEDEEVMEARLQLLQSMYLDTQLDYVTTINREPRRPHEAWLVLRRCRTMIQFFEEGTEPHTAMQQRIENLEAFARPK